MRTKCWWLAFFVVAVLASISGHAAPREPAPAKPRPEPSAFEKFFKSHGFESMPVTHGVQGHLMANIQFDGISKEFLVDTGWSLTTINSSLAKYTTPVSRTLTNIFTGKATNVAAGVITNMRIGGVSFSNCPALFGGKRGGGGVLGGDFLLQARAILDCTEPRLYIPGAGQTEKQARAAREGLISNQYRRIPWSLHDALVPVCEAKINGKPINLLIDSGAVWTMVDNDYEKSLGLKSRRIMGVTIHYATGTQSALDVAVVKRFQVGEVGVQNFRLGIVKLDSVGFDTKRGMLTNVAGLLGGAFMAYHEGLIDYETRSLWLR